MLLFLFLFMGRKRKELVCNMNWTYRTPLAHAAPDGQSPSSEAVDPDPGKPGFLQGRELGTSAVPAATALDVGGPATAKKATQVVKALTHATPPHGRVGILRLE